VRGLTLRILSGISNVSALPIPVAARSKTWVCGLWLAKIAGSNRTEGVVSVECCQVEVSALGCSLVQRSPTDCGVTECDRKTSIIRSSWPTVGCCVMEKCPNIHCNSYNKQLIISFYNLHQFFT
jgi:hypothetical protein